MSPALVRTALRAWVAAALLASSGAMGALQLASESTGVAPGQTFVATLSLDSFAGIETVDVTFDFDPAALSLESVTLAPGVPAPFFPIIVSGQGAGVLYLEPLSGGSGPFLQAQFAVDPAAPLDSNQVIDVRLRINERPLIQADNPLTVTIVPEPASAVLLAAGLAVSLAGFARRRTAAR